MGEKKLNEIMSMIDELERNFTEVKNERNELLAEVERWAAEADRHAGTAQYALAQLEAVGKHSRFLVNELKGSMPLAEVALREEMGNTNFHCLEKRRDELDSILAILQPDIGKDGG